MPAGAGVKQWFTLPTSPIDGASEILHAVVQSTAGKTVNDNWIPLTSPKNMKLAAATVTFAVASAAGIDGTIAVTVSANYFALYVTLTTLAQGRFSDNAFCMPPGNITLSFLPFDGFELAELRSSLRIEHAAMYVSPVV
jgi:hypothetical protein